MSLNYAIFRSAGINTLNDLAGIGAHNQRAKKAYKSNPDIDITKSQNNITIVPLNETYVKGFHNKTKEYKKQFETQMKNTRKDRRKTYSEMLNNSKNVVADELIFTASHNFFKNMSREDIINWANTSMDFVYNDLGYAKNQVLHSVVHMDEKTPHIHCVVIPLIKKYDKRTKSERYTISKKQYIKDNIHLSKLQDKYHERLVNNGFDLERGIKKTDVKHIPIKEFKKLTNTFNNRLDRINSNMDIALNDYYNQLKTNKNIPFDKSHILVKPDTLKSIDNVIKETKKAMEIQPKLESIYKEVKSYSNNYNNLERENYSLRKELLKLTERNEELENTNSRLLRIIGFFINQIKDLFRQILLIGAPDLKDKVVNKTKEYYREKHFQKEDVIEIAKNTDKQKELYNEIGYKKQKDRGYER